MTVCRGTAPNISVDRAQVAQQRGLALDTAGAVLKEQIPGAAVFSHRRGLAALSVLPLGPKFLIHIVKTELTQLLKGVIRQGQKQSSSCKPEHNSHTFLFAIYQLGICPVLFLQGALFSLLSFHYFHYFHYFQISRSVICFRSTDTQI